MNIKYNKPSMGYMEFHSADLITMSGTVDIPKDNVDINPLPDNVTEDILGD